MNQQKKPNSSDDLWLAHAVPRYTSYPPAPAFHDGVSSMDYASELPYIAPETAISIYIHIPFCKELCLYCGCHTSITRNQERVSQYISALKKEIMLLTSLMGRRQKLGKLHFGGGTPNILSTPDIMGLFSTLHDHFDLSSCNEIAMELDPRSVDKEQTKTLATCGVNRVSLGVQDFNPEVQKAVNRLQSLDMIKRVCGNLRNNDINQINFDLMYGLPLQTPKTVASSAIKTCELLPERISLFSYAHLPKLKKHQKSLEAYTLPDKHMLLKMENAARNVFVNAGYKEIGMDHFSRPDDNLSSALNDKTLRRNFQGYTDDGATTLLGIGASSIGQIPQNYYQNERDISLYQDKISNNQLAIVRGIKSSDEDALRAAIIEELMCYMSCDIAALCQKHDFPISTFSAEFDALTPFKEAGIIEQKGLSIKLVTEQRMAIRVICHVFDRYAVKKNAISSRAA